MEKGERKNVYQVYNKIASWYAENQYTGLMEKKYLDAVLKHLPAGADILDLGCGNGKPIMDYLLSQNMAVLGVDASVEMLNMAKANCPGARFLLRDMRNLHLAEKFDCIIAWHSFFHLPADDQPNMFSIFRQHLKPNGILLFTSGTERGEAWGMNGGENLFHASLAADEYHSLLGLNKFVVLQHQINDPECGGANVWMAQYQPQ